jgi:hypothetical protein
VHPVTKGLQDLLAVWREKLRDRLEGGLLIRDTEWEAANVRCQIVGNLDVLNQLRGLDYELLISELNDD